MNVYSFHAMITSNADKRERKELRHEQEGFTLNQAWDVAERKLAAMFPNHIIALSIGNRQPVQLRPGYRQAI